MNDVLGQNETVTLQNWTKCSVHAFASLHCMFRLDLSLPVHCYALLQIILARYTPSERDVRDDVTVSSRPVVSSLLIQLRFREHIAAVKLCRIHWRNGPANLIAFL